MSDFYTQAGTYQLTRISCIICGDNPRPGCEYVVLMYGSGDEHVRCGDICGACVERGPAPCAERLHERAEHWFNYAECMHDVAEAMPRIPADRWTTRKELARAQRESHRELEEESHRELEEARDRKIMDAYSREERPF